METHQKYTHFNTFLEFVAYFTDISLIWIAAENRKNTTGTS